MGSLGMGSLGMGMTAATNLNALVMLVLALQLPAIAVLLSRLLPAPWRHPPLRPQSTTAAMVGQVSVIVPTLNEADRLSPCLSGLQQQGDELAEILIVDSRSTDGTAAVVKAAQASDERLQLMEDPALPSDWVGRPWALHNGFLASTATTTWILGLDADTQPQPGLIASLLQTAAAEGFDLITLSPRFILRDPGELWLQPALLMTLVYRFGATGEMGNAADRIMANGQCFFCRKSVLTAMGGYEVARQSFCDDVTLARAIAQAGYKVGFLDGAALLQVRMYEGWAETWREWGRSLDLKDASTRAQISADLWLLTMVQGLPIGLLMLGLGLWTSGSQTRPVMILIGLNCALLLIRFALGGAILPSYNLSFASSRWLFWLSPFADPLAVLRIWLSASRKPTQWRGRQYG
jgi:dolichol-phosphate mannosyltransferase